MIAIVNDMCPREYIDEVMEMLKRGSDLMKPAQPLNKSCSTIPSVNAKSFLRNVWLFQTLVQDGVFHKRIFK